MVSGNIHHFAFLEKPLSYSKSRERKSKNYPYKGKQNCLCRFVRGYGHTCS